MRDRLTTLCVVLCALMGALATILAPNAAAAKGQVGVRIGVHVDPNDPVAKEYAIPLSTARGVPPGGNSGGSLFGQGITKAPSTPSSAATPTGSASGSVAATRPAAGADGKHHSKRHQASRPVSGSAPATPKTQVPPADTVLHAGSGTATIWMIVIAIAVIGIALIGGLVISRSANANRRSRSVAARNR